MGLIIYVFEDFIALALYILINQRRNDKSLRKNL